MRHRRELRAPGRRAAAPNLQIARPPTRPRRKSRRTSLGRLRTQRQPDRNLPLAGEGRGPASGWRRWRTLPQEAASVAISINAAISAGSRSTVKNDARWRDIPLCCDSSGRERDASRSRVESCCSAAALVDPGRRRPSSSSHASSRPVQQIGSGIDTRLHRDGDPRIRARAARCPRTPRASRL